MNNQTSYVTIKDEDGILRPKAYLESQDRHLFQKQPPIEEGESFVEVQITEVV